MSLLKTVVNEAAGEKEPETYPLGYVEDLSRRERSWAPVSATDLEFADSALQDGDLCHGIAGGFQLGADLVFEIGRVADAVDEEIKKALGGQQALGPEFFDRVVADRNIGAADVEHG